MKGVDVRQSRTEHSLSSAQQGLLQGRTVPQVLACPPLLLLHASLALAIIGT